MAEVCLPDVSRSKIFPCCRCFSCGRWQTLSFRCADIRALVGYVQPHQNPGGEFSSLYQNTFHHYRDFWCFDITTRSWDRIETKVRPSARSGHRFAFLYLCFYCPLFSERYLEWPCGSITLSCSAGFTIQALPVSVLKYAVRSVVNAVIARYMNDLWLFDMQEYKWQQIEFKDPNERRPS
jgi:hypothetical protein